jgi:antitoxin component of RelBE/YafQ-DinJ toxin-antitoxin module
VVKYRQKENVMTKTMVTKRPSAQITSDTDEKVSIILKTLGITESMLTAMTYNYVARTGKVPAEFLELSQEEMEAVRYQKAQESIVKLARKRPRVRATKENIDEVLHAEN